MKGGWKVGRGVMQFAEEPIVPSRVSLETLSEEEWLPHRATIVNLTRHEVWIRTEESLVDLLPPESRVRLVLRGPIGATKTAETIVLWHMGGDDLLVVLLRPTLWDPPSRRAHSRAELEIPVLLSVEEDMEPVRALTTNLGVGGACCISDRPIPVGQVLAASLQLAPHRSVNCQAEVVRQLNNPDDPSGPRMVLALRFLGLTEDHQVTIAMALADLIAAGASEIPVERAS
jgi:hypothetical protein